MGRKDLESSTQVLEVTTHGPILRITFVGVHRDGVGYLVSDYVRRAIELQNPVALVLDFLHFKYRFGDDIGGIVHAFIRKGPNGLGTVRPTAIVATGGTAKSLLGLLWSAKVLDTFGVKFFDDVESAVEHLRTRLGMGTA